jgi:hypothetical protein
MIDKKIEDSKMKQEMKNLTISTKQDADLS